MKLRSVKFATVLLVSFLLAGASVLTSCSSWFDKPKPDPRPDPSADALREKTAELAKAGDAIKTLQSEIDAAKKIAATAGAGVHGVQIAADRVTDEPTKQAVIAEATAAKTSLDQLAAPDPAASAAAELRVGRVVSQELDATKKQLTDVSAELAQRKADLAQSTAKVAAQTDQLAQHDKRIQDQDAVVAAKGKEVESWTQKWQTEHNNRWSAGRQIAEERAAADRAALRAPLGWCGRVVALAGMALIVGGLLIFALTSGEALTQGILAVLAGALVVTCGLKIEALWLSKLFPYTAGVVTALALTSVGWALFYTWQTHQLYRKITAALQDAKDESAATGSDVWNELREHLKYRLNDGRSYWSLTLKERLVIRGLRAEGPTPASAPVRVSSS